jgi:hypothetical protein
VVGKERLQELTVQQASVLAITSRSPSQLPIEPQRLPQASMRVYDVNGVEVAVHHWHSHRRSIQIRNVQIRRF